MCQDQFSSAAKSNRSLREKVGAFCGRISLALRGKEISAGSDTAEKNGPAEGVSSLAGWNQRRYERGL